MANFLSKLMGGGKDPFENESFNFLAEVKGVIHLGANSGQERRVYARRDLPVVWVEPIEEVFRVLVQNLREFPKQRAVRHLVTNRDSEACAFHISDNEAGASSSIFEFAGHREIWPTVGMKEVRTMRSSTLPSLLRAEGIAAEEYDALVMDTQGSELLILEGARELLPGIRYVKSEVADFESYRGGCQLKEMDAFMAGAGFERELAKAFERKKDVGTYYDVVYRNRAMKK